MRRLSIVLSLVAVMFLGLALGARFGAGALAQEGTPSAENDFEGITFEPLAVASELDLPSPGDLVLVRIELESGAVLPSDPEDPSLAMVLVEEGELTVALDGPVTVTRAGTFAPAVATAGAGGEFVAPEEAAVAGEEVTLQVGDVAFIPPNVGGEVRNDGEELAVGLAFIVAPPEEDGEDGATPGAEAEAAAGDEAAAVEIADFAFSPDTLTVAAGSTVTWTNADGTTHTATADDGAFDSDRLAEGDSYEETFDEPGTYAYHCDIHRGMEGTIVVE